jgi:O-antigen/teichoic acid export membrane protein
VSRGKTFLKSASLLMSGTLVAQAITFSLSFVLARLYLPDDFGRYSIFAGCAGVLAAAATCAFDRVILLAGPFETARKAATLTLVSAGAVALAIMIIAQLLTLLGIGAILPIPVIDVIAFIPAFIFCYAASQVFVYSSLREDRVRSLAILKVTQSAIMGAVQLVAAGFTLVSGLILGNVAGWFVLMVAGLQWRWQAGHVREDVRIGSLIEVARQNWQYPRYIMPNELIDNLSNQIPLILIGTFLSLSQAGHYGLAIMILSAPTAVVGQAVGQSFLQYLGKHGDDTEAVRRYMYRIWFALASIGLLPFSAILFHGQPIFGIAFGTSWLEAGNIAQSLAVLLFVRFISSPTSTIYLKLNMQREQWRFCIAAAIYRTASYALGIFGYELATMIVVHVASEIIAIFLYNLTALKRLKSLRLEGPQPREVFE